MIFIFFLLSFSARIGGKNKCQKITVFFFAWTTFIGCFVWWNDKFFLFFAFSSSNEDDDDFASYTLTFNIEFRHDNDTVYFSHSYPYTYTDLQVISGTKIHIKKERKIEKETKLHYVMMVIPFEKSLFFVCLLVP